MYVGFDIGGTTIKYGLLNELGSVLEQNAIDTRHELVELLADLSAIVKNYQARFADIKGVGISAPGIVQKDGTLLTAGAIKPIYGVNLKIELEKIIDLPVAIENDGNAAAIAEHWIGNAQGIDNYLCIVLGTGLGAGIVLNGQVYRGQHGMAGEFGWMLIKELPAEDNIEFVSMNWKGAVILGLCRLYTEALREIDPQQEDIIDARIIFERREAGEQLATEILAQYYEDLSVMLLNLIAIFDPERILIGGGISANDLFMEELKAVFAKTLARHESLAYLPEEIIAKIMPAELKNNAGMIGAVYQIHQQLKK
ncbi:ROK family protein [Enterococcus timonensis]|uniref:ROK family protein n=1 Tax=Enterococcus timonensis TaxID=1852364 RepID=UPI0008DA2095|nr:ROK family protein [Enterococcus timonensis]